MLPTFVIALREGLEASLIVGIVAAFLNQRGRRDLLRLLWVGVAAASLVCLAVGVGLRIFSADLPQRQQEGLETVVGSIAVVMVTYMVVWMRRHSRGLKKQLEGAAELAMESGSGLALVTMAFLAVFREGFETAVFMLAAFNGASNPAAAGGGAILGLVLALLLGYGLYRGGVRLNLSKFFRATGVVLVLVAGGLVVSALHTAHEAGWLDAGQSATVDLSWLVSPGSVQSSLLTGMLGLQPHPVLIELVGWLVYVIPVGMYTAWPPGRSASHRTLLRVGAALSVGGVVAALVALAVRPAPPSAGGQAVELRTTSGVVTARLLDVGADRATVRLGTAGRTTDVVLTRTPQSVPAGSGRLFGASGVAQPSPAGLPTSATVGEVTRLNGGRLPLGARAAAGPVPLTYSTKLDVQAGIDAAGATLLSVRTVERTTTIAGFATGPAVLGSVRTVSAATTTQAERAASKAVNDAAHARSSSADWNAVAVAGWTLALLAGLAATGSALVLAMERRRRRTAVVPEAQLVGVG